MLIPFRIIPILSLLSLLLDDNAVDRIYGPK